MWSGANCLVSSPIAGQAGNVGFQCIVRDPTGFLFDEPLSNLDAALRIDMRVEIARLPKRLAAAMACVTHDQVGAMTLADRIVVLKDGVIARIGTPRELCERPANLLWSSSSAARR